MKTNGEEVKSAFVQRRFSENEILKVFSVNAGLISELNQKPSPVASHHSEASR